jgi:death-on-curing protein
VTAFRWVELDVVFAVHDRQIAEHGGLDGVRDLGALESALARPRNAAAYGEPDAGDLAAAYAFGLARGHAFMDGNKRTTWVTARLFLADNGLRLRVAASEAVRMVEGLAAGTVDEARFAGWIRLGLAG